MKTASGWMPGRATGPSDRAALREGRVEATRALNRSCQLLSISGPLVAFWPEPDVAGNWSPPHAAVVGRDWRRSSFLSWRRRSALNIRRDTMAAPMQARTIRLYLVDGTPTGMLATEIINWTGKVLVSARSQLADLAKRDEARRTGMYCLVGRDPENPNQDCVYIGESDNVLSRLALHERDESKEFWTRTIIITSKDENLTKSHGRYLESRLIQMGHAAGRAKLTNATAPPAPSLPEADIADMEYFLEQIQMILPVLGFNFLQPKPAIPRGIPAIVGAAPVFCIESVGVKAEARELDGEFVVLKGSTARKKGTASWRTYRGLRDDLIASGRLVEATDPEFLVFAEDVPFASPSAAATVVRAGNANGRKEWKEATTGKSYADWQDLQLRLAGVSASGPEE